MSTPATLDENGNITTRPLATKKKPPLSVRLPPDILDRLDRAVTEDPDCVNRNQAIVAAVTTHVAKMERDNRRRARTLTSTDD